MLPLLPLLPPFLMAQVQSQGPIMPLPPPAEALLKAQDWGGLADWFETVSPALRGTHYELWMRCLNRSQRWSRLLEVCEAVQPQLEAKSGPRLGTCRLYRAQALSQLGRHREAAAAHAENGKLGHPDGYPNACAEDRMAQDWPALLTHAEALLALRPGGATATAWKGESLARMDRFTEAEPFLKEAVAKDPGIAYAWNNLGRCLNERQAWTEADDALNRALALEPNQLEALFNRGRARFELKRYQESRDDFRAALALHPDDPVIAENLRQAERYAALPAPKMKRR